MPHKRIQDTPTFNLVGNQFVKMFREYLISLTIENKDISEFEMIKRAFQEKNVKPETTRKYLKELKDLEII